MGRLLVDVSYWAFERAYASLKAEEEGKQLDPFESISTFIKQDTLLAFDGVGSLRKDVLPWYKANRKNPSESAIKLREKADHLIRRLGLECDCEYEHRAGLEGDDIIALHAKPGDWVLGNDKDYLQFPDTITLFNLRNEFWGIERFHTELNVKRGNSALAFQLLFGDVADNIPRRLYGNKELAKWIFEQDNPLYEAINFIPEQQAVTSLCALMLPTPLMDMRVDVINYALGRYNV